MREREASRSPVATSSPRLSASVSSLVGSPKVDEGAAEDVQPRHLGEEAAARIPETLDEDEEAEADDADEVESQSAISPQTVATQSQEASGAEASPTTPQPKQTSSAFGFASQPMSLDLSPVRSVYSSSSSPASSPRKNAHRRQNTNTVSLATRLPPASLGLARQRLNQVLQRDPETPEPAHRTGDSDVQQRQRYPQTPVNGGILSSAKKAGLGSLARRGQNHSVRFSPRPDYRSDSGSWDESGTQPGEVEDYSRDAAVERLLLPAQPNTIPEVLATASVPLAQGGTMQQEEEEEEEGETEEEEDEEEVEASLAQVNTSVARAEENDEAGSVGQPHTTPPFASATFAAAAAAAIPTHLLQQGSGNDSSAAATSFSQSVRFQEHTPILPSKHLPRAITRDTLSSPVPRTLALEFCRLRSFLPPPRPRRQLGHRGQKSSTVSSQKTALVSHANLHRRHKRLREVSRRRYCRQTIRAILRAPLGPPTERPQRWRNVRTFLSGHLFF